MNTPKIRFKGFADDWEQRKLCEITNYSNGKGHEGNQSDEGSYELINLNSISIDGGLKPSGKFIEDGTDTLLENDLVMVLSDVGHGDLLGRVAIIPENNRFVLNQRVALLRIMDNTNPYFLFSIINKHQAYFKKEGAGSSQLNISKSSVENFVVDYPQIEEQIKIANYFENLDNLITLHQRKCDETKQLKKFMLQKMFPKNGEKNPEIRFEGFTDDWEQRKLEDVAEFLDTMRKPLEGARRIPGPYPYYGASGIVDYVDGYLFNEELVLLSEDGANITDRNYPVCFLASGKYWVNNHAHVLRLKDGNENNFVCTSLERKDYKQYNSGMAMPKLNQEVCRRIPIGCPSFNEQKKIGDYFRNLDNLITLHQRKCEKLKELKKFMLQNMFV